MATDTSRSSAVQAKPPHQESTPTTPSGMLDLIAALRESEARTRAILDTAVDAIITIDEHGIIESLNPAAERLFGYQAREALGRNITLFMPEPHRHAHYQYLARYRASGAPRIIGMDREVLGLRRDGSVFPMTLAVSETWLGARRIFTGIVHDITQRRGIEQALIRQVQQQAMVAALGQQALGESSLASLFQEAITQSARVLEADYGAILELNLEGTACILRAGVGWRATTGITVETGTASQEGYVLMGATPVVVEELTAEQRFQGSLLCRNHGVVSGASVLIRGQERPFGVLSVYTRHAHHFSQDDVYFLEAVANVLAGAILRAQAEAALQQTHETLEKRAQERTARLAAANEDVRRFAYIVSHDLRAPLINLQGFVGELHLACQTIQAAIQESLPGLTPERRQAVLTALESDVPEALHFIDASVTRMERLIRAILQLSRLGQRQLHYEDIDVQAMVDNVLQTLAHQMGERQVRMEVESLPSVRADRMALEQILSNLLTNAVHYLEAGRPGVIRVTATPHPQHTTISVEDNGRGIAPEDIPKIFESFRRVGSQDVPGEGMGLAYVEALVKRHGGQIWCHSTPGVGTTMRFTIAQQLEQGEVDGI